MPKLFYSDGSIAKTGAPMGSGPTGPEQYVPEQYVLDQGFDIVANLPWMVPATIALLALIWRVFVWFKSRREKVDDALREFGEY